MADNPIGNAPLDGPPYPPMAPATRYDQSHSEHNAVFRRATETHSPACLAGRFYEVRLMWIRESQNTQSPRLRFCALLTEGSDPGVHLHRA
jgi:hypothetical protein